MASESKSDPLSVECPYCGAPPGQICDMEPQRSRRFCRIKSHGSRIKAASAARPAPEAAEESEHEGAPDA